LIPFLNEKVTVGSAACRYGIETGLMLFRLNRINPATIRALARPSRTSPEQYLAEHLHPQILPLKGDRDEEPAEARGVLREGRQWLMHASAESMERFYATALERSAC
jgi:hypothetical protein